MLEVDRGEDSTEIKQLCIFCEIIEGKQPADIIYTGKSTLVILSKDGDEHPIILPKKHYDNWADPNFDRETAREIGEIRLVVIPLVQKIYSVTGVASIALTGSDAGQTVNHAHEHIIPCPAGQKTFTVRENLFPLTREDIATRLRSDITQILQLSE